MRCGAKNEHSMCCRWNTDVGPDTCRRDGLCANEGSITLLWRESCTDPTWQDEGCLKLCYEGMGQVKADDDKFYELANMNVQITRCGDGSFCCGERGSIMATECCDNGEGVWIVEGKKIVTEDPSKPKTTTSSTSSTSSTATAESTTSSDSESSRPTSSMTSSDSVPAATVTLSQSGNAPSQSSLSSASSSASSINIGVIVGAVVAGVLGLALIGVLIWFLVIKKRRRNPYAPAELHSDSLSEVDGSMSATTKYASTGVNELYGREQVSEISGSGPVHEIGSHRPHLPELEGCTVPTGKS